METERKLAEYISKTRFEDLPRQPIDAVKDIVLNLTGTTIAGSASESCEAIVRQVKDWGGKEEATILVHGGKVPAYNAAFVNSYMARALDVDDSMLPGIHPGASTVMTGLAVAEMAGGCSGEDFLAALVLGHEIAARMNLAAQYNGFDPTGIAAPFGTATVAAKLLKLDTEQILNALAIVFNKAAGSFQSNIDGALAVRAIQGFSAQSGVIAAQLAQIGVSGPGNFIEGLYGYFHLYAQDKYNTDGLLNGLGQDFLFPSRVVYKRYPSCACTEAGTDAILAIAQEKGITPEDVEKIDVRVSRNVFNLVGHPFEMGRNPRVNAQFSIQYCVASALLRKKTGLQYFEEDRIRDPRVLDLVKKIHVSHDPGLDGAMQITFKTVMKVRTKKGDEYTKVIDHPKGDPENPLTREEFMECFRDYITYGVHGLPDKDIHAIVSTVGKLEQLEDVRGLIALLTPKSMR